MERGYVDTAMHRGRMSCKHEGKSGRMSCKPKKAHDTSKPLEARGEAWNRFFLIAQKELTLSTFGLGLLVSRTMRQYISIV